MLTIRNLRGGYGRIEVLHGVSLSVRPGEVVALVGANGAGKSTLLKAVSGLLPQWTGEILFEGRELSGRKPPEIVSMGVGLVPEGRWIFPPLSVLDNLRLGAYLRLRRGDKQGVEEELQRVYELFPILAERRNQPAGTLSGGEQQMLAIGRALMTRPRLLLLDEPTTGLAPLLVEKIFQIIARLRDEGLTFLLVEQNAQGALALADRGYVLETGRMVLQGRARDLLEDQEVKRAYLGRDYKEFVEGRA
ncbi:amino acid/amide ABC transporter ATP-binding protein 2, HAAT family [Desulfacinum infernum DSM 9756]|uniref:Amino acid/amide ABC transporter ATP-binding protein 2, HAAT family n=1 Tax=Desulfacinum infernum DSM 9756 TaxID=1121391 RepID=A0A1M5FHS9_9BACT|nr:ABC transporter ATP-binding protein [Desulfacinum infernum]SHF90702.1 amino acid/amide ABC transporter ATP-binding protein 2, HAAT family [Desulfacinum infernum DSM 9756]